MRSTLIATLALCLWAASGAAAQESQLTKDLMAFQGKVAALIDGAIQATVGLRLSNGQGSGVIVSEAGLVLTAAHVFDRPGQKLTIIMHDGRRVKGVTLGRHEGGDFGMVKIEEKGKFPFAQVGTLKDLPENALCLATGHPGGYQRGRPPVVRLGKIVSLRGPFVRSTCVIDQGDSGGPLFDMKGRVIGIHSRIRPSPEQNYHVSVDKYSDNWDRLKEAKGWPSLGVRAADNDGGGCEIERVYRQSAAEIGGLKRGDIISHVNKKQLRDVDALVAIIQSKRPGDKLELSLTRKGKKMTLVIELGTRQ